METIMRNQLLTVIAVALSAALTAQAAIASEHHHIRTKHHTAAYQRLLNSNASADYPSDRNQRDGHYDPGYQSNVDGFRSGGAGPWCSWADCDPPWLHSAHGG
jgi:Ni/Co efflux regulator RcnB